MKTLILAAGRGERLRPLTNHCPKPLISVAGKPLIIHHIERLSAAGCREIVINTAYLAEQIHQHLGDGSQFGVRIQFSYEGPDPLDSGGGVLKAMEWLGDQPFRFINADILTDYPFEQLALPSDHLAHLVLVPNPPYRDGGDFVLANNRVTGRGNESLTFSGIGVYHPQLLDGRQPGTFSIVPILEQAMARNLVSGECYRGQWHDVGTPERLQALNG